MGGHCLPVDPFYLAFKAREHDFYPEFIELAGKVNQAQPAFCVERIERALNEAGKPVNGSQILILGVSYKAGVGDTRESPALKIVNLLQRARRRRLLPRPLRARAARARPQLGRPRRRPWRRPTWPRSSPPTPASTTRPSPPRRRCWSTSAASPAASTPRTWSGSSGTERALGSVGLFEPGAFLLAFDDLGDQLLHVGVAGRLDVAGLVGLAVALHACRSRPAR